MIKHIDTQQKGLVSRLITILFAVAIQAQADEPGRQTFEQQCQGCHQTQPDTVSTLKQYWQRKGPDLSSAGIKYKQAWLAEWLQHPVRIRPAGMFYANHIKTGTSTDQIDDSTLQPHLALTASQAEVVAAALMDFKHNQSLVQPGAYHPGKITKTLGEMLFDKFKGCLACHQIEPGYGGLSGPEVYTAANRLQEDYLISFMRNPQAWEPKTVMPNKHLKETDLQKIVHYLTVLSQEEFQ